MWTLSRGREGAGWNCVHLSDSQLNARRASGREYPLGIVEPGGSA